MSEIGGDSGSCTHHKLLARQSRRYGTCVPKLARRVGAAPTSSSFGDSIARAGARRVDLVRPAGVAPAPPRWQRGVLLLNYERMEIVGPEHNATTCGTR